MSLSPQVKTPVQTYEQLTQKTLENGIEAHTSLEKELNKKLSLSTPAYHEEFRLLLKTYIFLINTSLGIKLSVHEKDTVEIDAVKERIANLHDCNTTVFTPRLGANTPCIALITSYANAATAAIKELEQQRNSIIDETPALDTEE